MKKQTDTAESITAENARAAVRRACKTRKQKDVAEGLGWKAPYLSTFLNSRSKPTPETVGRVKTYIGQIAGNSLK